MPPAIRRLLAISALALPAAGCDPNPDGPKVPPHTLSKPDAGGPPAAPPRQPVTKNPREIVNPD
jgi:hypothetical protein